MSKRRTEIERIERKKAEFAEKDRNVFDLRLVKIDFQPRNLIASSAAIAPSEQAVTTWRNDLSRTSPTA